MTTQTSTLRVLIAEDNPDHRYFLTRALRKAVPEGLDIREAHDGAEALEYLRGCGPHRDTALPDVVFLDLNMPGTDGFEVLEAVKSDAALASIPVVVLSSSDRRVDIDTAYRLGSNSYVTKAQDGPLEVVLPRIAEYWTAYSELPAAPHRS